MFWVPLFLTICGALRMLIPMENLIEKTKFTKKKHERNTNKVFYKILQLTSVILFKTFISIILK